MEFHQIIVGSTCPGYNLKLFSWLEISKHKLNEPILRLGQEQPSNGVLPSYGPEVNNPAKPKKTYPTPLQQIKR